MSENSELLNGLDAAIIYDGKCPFCAAYTSHLRLKAACGNVGLIDAREDGPLVWHVMDRGYNLDDGMVLILKDTTYYGERCIHALALMTSPSSTFNRINAFIFRSSKASAVLYPILKGGRNLVLRLLGRAKIHTQTG